MAPHAQTERPGARAWRLPDLVREAVVPFWEGTGRTLGPEDMSSSHADRQVLWEADVAHLKQTAAELLETNSRYASMFEVLRPPSSRGMACLSAAAAADRAVLPPRS